MTAPSILIDRPRAPRDGEQIETLDGVVRTLRGSDGVIADGSDAAIGIAAEGITVPRTGSV